MMWEDLRERIRGMGPFAELSGRLSAKGAHVPVTGLAGSSRSLVLAALERDSERPALVIAPDTVSARDIASDLEYFGMEGVVFYPEDETLPYDYHDPDRNLTGMQMSALRALVERRCSVLVCTVRSLLKKVFAPDVFAQLLETWRRGEDHDLHGIASRLVEMGYERHGTVESKGQFAIRGGILDIFEVASAGPVRLEFDGDELVSMRDFDVETQRSTGERDTLDLHPLHHLAPDEAGIERLRAFLEEAAAGADPDERAKILLPAERLAGGIHFFGMEHYAPVVHEVTPIFEYFSGEPLAVLYGSEDIARLLEEYRGEIAERFERSREENVYPGPERVFVGEEEWEAWLAGSRAIEFGAVGGRGAVRFSAAAVGDYRRNLKGLVADTAGYAKRGFRVFLFCSSEVQRERAEEILSEVSLDIDMPLGMISSGFRWPEAGVVFLSEEEVFGRFHRPFHPAGGGSRSLTYDPSHLGPGDFVVHLSHGIGRYMGMRVVEVEGSSTECLDIRYEGDDRLFIPVSQLRMVEKYTAAEGAAPALARLGSGMWNRARERARRSAEKVARDLVEIYAARQVARGFAFGPDKPWQKEMEASFPWEETPHQLQATAEVKADMEASGPMDRLLCGDVGFGKTEVAMRAAFKAVLAGKQVVFLVPTTVLALQHFNTLRDRLAGFPVEIEMLSRFVPHSKQRKIVDKVSEGKTDIVIGTHRLLSRDISFADLGLVVVDEEHRFGVRHKEKLKKMKKSVDVLSMTATPIPRTLSMAISGIRDISVIDTPPRNRLPIQTEILPFDDDRIREAVLRETGRGGQVFFVHNRVQSIEVMEGYLRRLLPERVRIAHAHGQMKERELERIMIDFLEHRFDVLLCTMIIEAGLDFPNVNTIIIDRADRFGLAQLYQLRGRVGRSDRRAWAHMLVPRGRLLTSTAIKRLQAITEFDYLGAGYRIAMRDLEIRGAGNLLGHQQSGQINAVGLDLYTRMIREEIAAMKGEEEAAGPQARISAPLPAYLPGGYITDSEERMDIYRRLSQVEDLEDLEAMRDELVDRFGRLPVEGDNMLGLMELRIRAGKAGIESVELDRNGRTRVGFAPERTPSRGVLAGMAEEFAGRLTFHTEDGFSLSLESAQKPSAPPGDHWKDSSAARDLEALLNLLEFSAK